MCVHVCLSLYFFEQIQDTLSERPQAYGVDAYLRQTGLTLHTGCLQFTHTHTLPTELTGSTSTGETRLSSIAIWIAKKSTATDRERWREEAQRVEERGREEKQEKRERGNSMRRKVQKQRAEGRAKDTEVVESINNWLTSLKGIYKRLSTECTHTNTYTHAHKVTQYTDSLSLAGHKDFPLHSIC